MGPKRDPEAEVEPKEKRLRSTAAERVAAKVTINQVLTKEEVNQIPNSKSFRLVPDTDRTEVWKGSWKSTRAGYPESTLAKAPAASRGPRFGEGDFKGELETARTLFKEITKNKKAKYVPVVPPPDGSDFSNDKLADTPTKVKIGDVDEAGPSTSAVVGIKGDSLPPTSIGMDPKEYRIANIFSSKAIVQLVKMWLRDGSIKRLDEPVCCPGRPDVKRSQVFVSLMPSAGGKTEKSASKSSIQKALGVDSLAYKEYITYRFTMRAELEDPSVLDLELDEDLEWYDVAYTRMSQLFTEPAKWPTIGKVQISHVIWRYEHVTPKKRGMRCCFRMPIGAELSHVCALLQNKAAFQVEGGEKGRGVVGGYKPGYMVEWAVMEDPVLNLNRNACTQLFLPCYKVTRDESGKPMSQQWATDEMIGEKFETLCPHWWYPCIGFYCKDGGQVVAEQRQAGERQAGIASPGGARAGTSGRGAKTKG